MFGEKQEEYSAKRGQNVPVWQTPKYQQSKAKALESMKKYPFLNEGDFWILMNETKTGKMAYTGLIISHNACLKLNDNMKAEDKFRPECVTVDKIGYGDSLVYTYCCPDQGLYEVGEASKTNCKNAYPYAMAYKRMFDRVVLKLCKMAFDGIYSDSEADEFKDPLDDARPVVATREVEILTAKSLCMQEIRAYCQMRGASGNDEELKTLAWLEKKIGKASADFDKADWNMAAKTVQALGKKK